MPSWLIISNSIQPIPNKNLPIPMKKSLTPNDLGDFAVVENSPSLSIREVVGHYQQSWKQTLLASSVKVGDTQVKLISSPSRWGGVRIWFACPLCQARCGVVLIHPATQQVGCRQCLNLKYKKQKYKNMIEGATV